MRLSDFVRRRRKELGITQQELSKRTGIYSSYLCAIESGIRGAGPVTAVPLAKALEVSEDLLHVVSGMLPISSFRDDISVEELQSAFDEFKAKVASQDQD